MIKSCVAKISSFLASGAMLVAIALFGMSPTASAHMHKMGCGYCHPGFNEHIHWIHDAQQGDIMVVDFMTETYPFDTFHDRGFYCNGRWYYYYYSYYNYVDNDVPTFHTFYYYKAW